MKYGGHFDPEQKQKRLNELAEIMKKPNFSISGRIN